ncbi:glycosyltransferase family 4 protein [Clostridium tetani]|uniref:Glycosyltransferase family 1 protein n=1 Tax=Clostridium tetani TaxID=1513 RepID=A0ABY0EV80_CLOTA|nr:glycosyltransferase family 1 protein [Clostridium tetani]KHO40333.1 glycosyl transferase [Clostridium tetani]RXI41083.1 glycosyltransferase family 1 protein [Clostridium tetani]RXI58500.1 glycosyltransferase family 1 protein [Clostridium tetani]RXI73212.1 glycosyltransferase family 1 protein [Clostridium tetani]
MKIGFDARAINLYNGTGIGTYTQNILKHVLDLDRENFYHIYWWGENYNDFSKDNSKVLLTSKRRKSFYEEYYFPANLDRESVDLYHVPQNGMGLSKNTSCKKVITVHDLIPYTMPETVGRGYLKKFLRNMPQLIYDADAIITVSKYSKKDILRFFPMDEKKIFVTHLAADEKYRPLNKDKCNYILKNHYNIDNPFILYIGGFSPRKNIKSLLISFSKIYKNLDKDYKLVIVGANKSGTKILMDMAKDLNIESKIIFTGFVPEDHLPILYNSCETFVYPSLYEGFGLPPLEAMCCGTPVITSNVTSIPEVVGDGGILINPNDIDELSNSLEKTLLDVSFKYELKKKALERSSLYSWENTAKNTLKVYNSIISNNI